MPSGPSTTANLRRFWFLFQNISPGEAKSIVSPPRFIPVVSWGPVRCLQQPLNLSLIINLLKLSKKLLQFSIICSNHHHFLKLLTSVFCRGSPLRSLGMMDRRDAMRAIVESREGRRSPLISGLSGI